uniref:Uncharacterized protein n=1 Tax=Plectus sambesii TaxID=2011161 RepID=A0A914WK16_9BILA
MPPLVVARFIISPDRPLCDRPRLLRGQPSTAARRGSARAEGNVTALRPPRPSRSDGSTLVALVRRPKSINYARRTAKTSGNEFAGRTGRWRLRPQRRPCRKPELSDCGATRLSGTPAVTRHRRRRRRATLAVVGQIAAEKRVAAGGYVSVRRSDSVTTSAIHPSTSNRCFVVAVTPLADAVGDMPRRERARLPH